MSRIRWTVLIVGVFVLVLGTVFVAAVLRNPVEAHGNLVGKPAPVVQFKTFDGTRVSTKPTAGHVVVVNFWNSWCAPCQQEESSLKQFYAQHKNDPDFTMVGIVRSDSTQAAHEYAQANKLGWDLVMDPGARAALAFGTTGQPETYVIGPDGLVAGAEYGPVSAADLNVMLSRARGVN